MKWRKLGLQFRPGEHDPVLGTHAANPVADVRADGWVRVFYNCRDDQQRSHAAYYEFHISQPLAVRRLAAAPVLSPGARGLFDDSGVSLGCLARIGEQTYLYYVGWNLGVTVPWRNSIGLAIGDEPANRFAKYSEAPLLDRHAVDPLSLSYPWVLRNGTRWQMWYGSNLSWDGPEGAMRHVIKYADSEDGLHWRRSGAVAISLRGPDEYALARPCVLKDGNLYRMWYSHRGPAYRLGYAESGDGQHWERRDDHVGITVSETGWDSEMLAYACVFDCAGERYMLYNGNGYGRTGIGLAILN